MPEALIGLIGVVAGALLGGVVSATVGWSKRRTQAAAAGSLIGSELEAVRTRMQGAIDEHQWWLGDLPTEIWAKHRGQLAFAMRHSDLDRLAAAYINVIDAWNLRRHAAEDSEKLSDETIAQLKTAKDEDLAKVKRIVTEYLAEQLAPARKIGRVVAVLSAALLAGVVADAAFVPRVDLTSTTVADAIQSKLGQQYAVECAPAGGNWLCTEYQLPDTRSACQLGAAGHSAQWMSGFGLIGALAADIVQCPEQGTPFVVIASETDADRLIVAPADLPTQAEQARAHDIIHVDDPRRTGLQMLLSWFGGH
jgi:hypothetical protein